MNYDLKQEDSELFSRNVQYLLPDKVGKKCKNQMQKLIDGKRTSLSLSGEDVNFLKSLKRQEFAKKGKEKEKELIIKILEVNNRKSDVKKKDEVITFSSSSKESGSNDKSTNQLNKKFYENISALLKEKKENLQKKRLDINYNFLHHPAHIKYALLFAIIAAGLVIARYQMAENRIIDNRTAKIAVSSLYTYLFSLSLYNFYSHYRYCEMFCGICKGIENLEKDIKDLEGLLKSSTNHLRAIKKIEQIKDSNLNLYEEIRSKLVGVKITTELQDMTVNDIVSSYIKEY